MPRIKDYPKYEDHVDKTMTWDKGNKELLPPGRTKLLQDGRFIFDMDDGTYTVSMQYFIENVLGLVNKDNKTIVSDITVEGFDPDNPSELDVLNFSLVIHEEEIDVDGNLTGHKTEISCPLLEIMNYLILTGNSILCGNAKTIENDGFMHCRVPYMKGGETYKDVVHSPMFTDVKVPLYSVTNISIADGKLVYKVGDDVKTLDLASAINSTISNSSELRQKVSDLVDFRMLPMTPLINSAITHVEVSDTGNMHWTSYDGNTTDGSYDFGALIAKKVAEAKPADLPTDLTRNLNISDSGTVTWTVNGEQKSVDIANGVTRQVNAKFAMRVDSLSQRVSKAVTNFDITNAGVTTWTSGGDSHTFDIGSMVDGKVDAKIKAMPKTTIDKYIKEFSASFSNDGTFTWVTSDGESHTFSMHDNLGSYFGPYKSRVETLESSKADQSWVKDQISQAITTYSSGAATGQRLAKFAKELNVDGGGTMTWTSSDGQSHSVNLRRFASSSSVSSIPESDVESVL